MIADLMFEAAAADGVRRASFRARSSVPIGAACVVAGGIREALREFVGAACEVVVGEPVAITPSAWAALSAQTHGFLVGGRATDIVLVLREDDARALVRTAFGEPVALGVEAFSVLEREALQRIVTRCAAALDPLCAERRGGVRAVRPGDVAACVAYFDVRVLAPASFALGVGLVRDLPDPGPGRPLSPSALARVPLELRAEFASGTISGAEVLAWRPGDIVRLDTKVGSPGALKIASRIVARGAAGMIGTRSAFTIDSLDQKGVWP